MAPWLLFLMVLFMVLFNLVATNPALAAHKTINKDQLPSLHAALVVKIAMFVEWPDYAPLLENGNVKLVVAGNEEIFQAFKKLPDKNVNGLELELDLHQAGAELLPCRIMFISHHRFHEILPSIMDPEFSRGVLTVGDSPDFNAKGGIIQLDLVNGRPRFTVNLEAAEDAGIKLSSKLLKVATIYKGERP